MNRHARRASASVGRRQALRPQRKQIGPGQLAVGLDGGDVFIQIGPARIKLEPKTAAAMGDALRELAADASRENLRRAQGAGGS